MRIFSKTRAPLFFHRTNMKGVDISCASQASMAMFSSMEHYPSSPSSQLSSSSSSCPQEAGGRAIDRHNPIITDAKRVTRTLGLSNKSPDSPNLNECHKDQEYKEKSRKLIDLRRKINNGDKEGNNDHDYQVNTNVCKPSDMISMKGRAAYKPGDYIRRPESRRYLLDDTPSLNVMSDFDPVSEQLVSYESEKCGVEEKKMDGFAGEEDNSKASKPGSSSTSTSASSAGSSDNQVVALMVSLHCKGCEGKVRKHLSRMEGVTSFDIDFAAKKVTVVGNVTPLGVLATISKVKNARTIMDTNPASSIIQ